MSHELIDFSECKVLKRAYGGVNGNKISVVYNNDVYMLKFPSQAKLNPNLHYSNGLKSEYIACHIFNDIGINAQETLLGTYCFHDNMKNVVACKDFTDPVNGVVLYDFASIKNQIIDSERHGMGTDLEDILFTISNQNIVDPSALESFFWDIFVVDAMIANPDRHNGNWGFLYNSKEDKMSIAPIYDCGSSLFAQADPDLMKHVIAEKKEQNIRVFERPTSAINLNNKRINYNTFFQTTDKDGCFKALCKIVPKIRLDRIFAIIDNVPGVLPEEVQFYKTIISARKEIMLDRALERAIEQCFPKTADLYKTLNHTLPDSDFHITEITPKGTIIVEPNEQYDDCDFSVELKVQDDKVIGNLRINGEPMLKEKEDYIKQNHSRIYTDAKDIVSAANGDRLLPKEKVSSKKGTDISDDD